MLVNLQPVGYRIAGQRRVFEIVSEYNNVISNQRKGVIVCWRFNSIFYTR